MDAENCIRLYNIMSYASRTRKRCRSSNEKDNIEFGTRQIIK